MAERKVDLGQFDHEFQFKVLESNDDGQGGKTTPSWVDVGAPCMGSLEFLSSYQRSLAAHQEHGSTHRIAIWARDDLKVSMRVTCGSRTFEITTAPLTEGDFTWVDVRES